MKILILGASGMLGHTLFSELSRINGLEVLGTVRSAAARHLFPQRLYPLLVDGVDAGQETSLEAAIRSVRPDVVINGIGLIRQKPEGQQALPCIEINARLPHLLLNLCRQYACRLIHYSTDCVFDGHKGSPYTEDDPPSATDVYGLSKFLGELHEAPALTLRTSIIGHELQSGLSLVEWFLAQSGTVRGFTRAIFSGLPAVEHARILADFVLPRPELSGLYHLAAQPISKFELLSLIARIYGKNICVTPDDRVAENKQLNADRFAQATGYTAPAWPQLIAAMHQSHLNDLENRP